MFLRGFIRNNFNLLSVSIYLKIKKIIKYNKNLTIK